MSSDVGGVGGGAEGGGGVGSGGQGDGPRRTFLWQLWNHAENELNALLGELAEGPLQQTTGVGGGGVGGRWSRSTLCWR